MILSRTLSGWRCLLALVAGGAAAVNSLPTKRSRAAPGSIVKSLADPALTRHQAGGAVHAYLDDRLRRSNDSMKDVFPIPETEDAQIVVKYGLGSSGAREK